MRNAKGQFIKGMTPWSKGTKGLVKAWNKRKTGIYSEDTLHKMSESGKKKVFTEEHRKHIGLAQKGKKHTEETKKKMSLASPHKKLSTEQREKLRQLRLGTKYSEERKKKISIATKGENNPNYRGGITPLVMRIRACFKYRQWRSDIFTRDNFTCNLCGDNKGGNLQADHSPKLFSEIFREYNIKTLEEALDCEEFWNLNNGRTLCKSCHQKYGRTR